MPNRSAVGWLAWAADWLACPLPALLMALGLDFARFDFGFGAGVVPCRGQM